jgi:integrase/recombinase XerC
VGANSDTGKPAKTASHPLLRGYLEQLTIERQLSPHTVESYGRDVVALLDLAGDTPLKQLQPAQVRRFVAQLHGRGLDGRSLARMLSGWRGFFNYLAKKHAFPHNPCVGIRAPKSSKKLPHALSPDEAVRLMNVGETTTLAVRDKAILELFYSSGLRLSELTGLATDGVNFRDGTVRVTGKGRKTRIVPVGSHAITALNAWLAEREKLASADEKAMFVGKDGHALGVRAVQVRLKHWALKLGLTDKVHPHALRHSFASHLLQSSGDIRAVQDMLGHASVSTTQIYTHLDFQHLAKVYDAAHPRARKKT